VTTFRGEGAYLDGRRPSSVTFSVTLDEDLARRDFTMNAIAFDPVSGVIIDPFDGQGDIARKLVRAVGDPFLRFTEDGLRPMRAVRQAAQLGFLLDPETQAAIPRTFASFRKVSAERIRDELRKLLLAPKPSLGLELHACDRASGRGPARDAAHHRLRAEPLPQARRLPAHPGHRGRGGSGFHRAHGRAPARPRQAQDPSPARRRAWRVFLLSPRARRGRHGREPFAPA
jgi:hypothetical protein